ncbi:hypothetical protein CDAR_59841 [Caerostris darwini]|uniref:Uncharacterized protein n=1 Tax=Caerostris darwini TaxID=1538125 RepID=A0AAV4RMT4_9ARAC|nr:hypothetical protein CDAR_59841 [Caerostris darwini]
MRGLLHNSFWQGLAKNCWRDFKNRWECTGGTDPAVLMTGGQKRIPPPFRSFSLRKRASISTSSARGVTVSTCTTGVCAKGSSYEKKLIVRHRALGSTACKTVMNAMISSGRSGPGG